MKRLFSKQYLNKGRLDNTGFNISSRIIFQALGKTIFPPTNINVLIINLKKKKEREESKRVCKNQKGDQQKFLHPN